MERVDKCIKIMKRIAKINGKTVDDAVYKKFYDTNMSPSHGFEEKVNYTLLDLFKTPRMRKITFVRTEPVVYLTKAVRSIYFIVTLRDVDDHLPRF